MHLVVFDIDGTLTDTNVVDGNCYWRAVCEVLGLSGAQPDWSTFRHVTDAGFAAELCLHHHDREVNGAEIDAIGVRLAALLEVALVSNDPVAHQIPGSAEVLSILGNSGQFAVALATGGLHLSAELKLRRAGLGFAGQLLASSSDAVSRPDILRIALVRAAKKYRTRFATFTYVGDGIWDVKAAQALGWRFIGIGAGEQAERLRGAGAIIVIPDYRPAERFMKLLISNCARII